MKVMLTVPADRNTHNLVNGWITVNAVLNGSRTGRLGNQSSRTGWLRKRRLELDG